MLTLWVIARLLLAPQGQKRIVFQQTTRVESHRHEAALTQASFRPAHVDSEASTFLFGKAPLNKLTALSRFLRTALTNKGVKKPQGKCRK
jgi:hypothetical protein